MKISELKKKRKAVESRTFIDRDASSMINMQIDDEVSEVRE